MQDPHIKDLCTLNIRTHTSSSPGGPALCSSFFCIPGWTRQVETEYRLRHEFLRRSRYSVRKAFYYKGHIRRWNKRSTMDWSFIRKNKHNKISLNECIADFLLSNYLKRIENNIHSTSLHFFIFYHLTIESASFFNVGIQIYFIPICFSLAK